MKNKRSKNHLKSFAIIGSLLLSALFFFNHAQKAQADCDPNHYICVSTDKSSAAQGDDVAVTAQVTQGFVDWFTGPTNMAVPSVKIELMVLTDAQVNPQEAIAGEVLDATILKGAWVVDKSNPEATSETTTWKTSGTTPGNLHIWLKMWTTYTENGQLADLAKATTDVTITATGGGSGGTTAPVISDSDRESAAGSVQLAIGQVTDLSSLATIIINLLKYAVWAAALIGLIYGGITFMEAAGDPNKAATAKKFILYSLIGLVLAIFTQVIINAASSTLLQWFN